MEHVPRHHGPRRPPVNRSASIGTLFTRIKKKQITFPRADDCGSFLDEFAGEVAEYDDVGRSIKYTHAATQQDDALHAANYALLLATLVFNAR